MNFDAFSAGVEPGGLRSKQDIKVLICYILSNLNSVIKKLDILSILQKEGIVNYFEASEAFSELLIKNNIEFVEEKSDTYKISKTGRMISDQLQASLPRTIKDRVIAAAKLFLERAKSEEENKVKIEKTINGYNVSCKISGGDFDLMSISLYAPDMEQAIKVRENFYQDPSLIYDIILCCFTKNKDYIKEINKKLISFVK